MLRSPLKSNHKHYDLSSGRNSNSNNNKNNSNTKVKRSYLDKGPTKEQVRRRNLLMEKLRFGIGGMENDLDSDNDDDDGSSSMDEDEDEDEDDDIIEDTDVIIEDVLTLNDKSHYIPYQRFNTTSRRRERRVDGGIVSQNGKQSRRMRSDCHNYGDDNADDDDDDDDISDYGDMPLAGEARIPTRSSSAAQRFSRSLSPKTFGRKVRELRGVSTSPSESSNHHPLPVTRNLSRPRELMRSMSLSSRRTRTIPVSPSSSPKVLGGKKGRVRSKSTSKPQDHAHPDNDHHQQQQQQRRLRSRPRQGSINSNSRSLSPGNFVTRSRSTQSTKSPSIKRTLGRSRSGDAIDTMRKSLVATSPKGRNGSERRRRKSDGIIIQNQHYHNLDSDEDINDKDLDDDENLLERVARRVAARRGNLKKNKTDSENLLSMQRSLQRREKKEQEDAEKIGGIWAKGLKALEKVYDDING